MRYRHEDDPFIKVGPIRTIVAKHNGHKDSLFNKRSSIIHTDIFRLGLACKGDKYSITNSWILDEWDCHNHDIVDSLLRDKPHGLYEIVGELYHHGWTSGYETPEYESEMDIRKEQIQAITYDEARAFSDDFFQDGEICLMRLIDKDVYCSGGNTEIHHFMTEHQILTNQAYALGNVIRQFRYGISYVSLDKMSIEELKSYIFICMMEIDSESNKTLINEKAHALSLKIDEEVNDTLIAHREMFDEKKK